MPLEEWPEGPIILGVEWDFPEHLVRTAEALAAALKVHLVCAFVDPASYLIEWEPVNQRAALSLDPSINEEAEFPSGQLQARLEAILRNRGTRGPSASSMATSPRPSTAWPKAPTQLYSSLAQAGQEPWLGWTEPSKARCLQHWPDNNSGPSSSSRKPDSRTFRPSPASHLVTSSSPYPESHLPSWITPLPSATT